MTRLKYIRMPEGKRKTQIGILEAFCRNFFPIGLGYGFPDPKTGEIIFFSAKELKESKGIFKITSKKRGKKTSYFLESESLMKGQRLPAEIGSLLYDLQEFDKYFGAYRDCEARVYSLLDFTLSSVSSNPAVARSIKSYFAPDEKFRDFFKEWKALDTLKNENIKNQEYEKASEERISEVDKSKEMVVYLQDKFPGTRCFKFEKVLRDVLVETSKMMFVAL